MRTSSFSAGRSRAAERSARSDDRQRRGGARDGALARGRAARAGGRPLAPARRRGRAAASRPAMDALDGRSGGAVPAHRGRPAVALAGARHPVRRRARLCLVHPVPLCQPRRGSRRAAATVGRAWGRPTRRRRRAAGSRPARRPRRPRGARGADARPGSCWSAGASACGCSARRAPCWSAPAGDECSATASTRPASRCRAGTGSPICCSRCARTRPALRPSSNLSFSGARWRVRRCLDAPARAALDAAVGLTVR